VDIYFSSAGRNGVLLLNVPPDTRGRISDADETSLMGMHAILERTFGSPVAGLSGSRAVPTADRPMTFEVLLGNDSVFDVVMLREDIRQGQRVEAFRLDTCIGDRCIEFARGTTIGYKRLLRFPEVRIAAGEPRSRLRLTIEQSRGTPVVSGIGVYKMAQ
jgi:alpha-L-fucosidase